MKKVFFLVTFSMILGITINAQVTIGKNESPEKGAVLDLSPKNVTHGGLLLPNVQISNSDSIPTDLIGIFSDAERDNYPNLKGLLVYNTNENMVGGNGTGLYSWDGGKWSGEGSNFTTICNSTSFIDASGGSISCAVTDPACKAEGVYTFNFISGKEYSQLNVTDAGAGTFTLTLDANDRAVQRTVILIVTSPCGKNQTLLYTQNGDDTGCESPASNPSIKAENNLTTLCSGGAVYLYLEGAPDGNYIWTLNGEEVGTGHQLVATRTGKYIVYANKIGCTTKTPGEIIVISEMTGAPGRVSLIAKNNGLLCSPEETVKLFASGAENGTIAWYKNGQRTNYTGSSVEAGIGTWFAVVEDGMCMSRPSDPVTVQLDPNAGTGGIFDFGVTVNETALSETMTLCGGGSLNLAVIAPQPGVNYTWYNNNTIIGQGDAITYSMSELTGSFILRCRATGLGSCSIEKLTEATITLDPAPERPYISVSNPGNALCNGTAILTANVSETVSSFIWYYSEDNHAYQQSPITTQILSINRTGYYKVAAVSGTCVSDLSIEKNIALSSALTDVTIEGPNTVNLGDSKTYTALMDNPQGAQYAWSISNAETTGATIQGPTNGSSVVVNYTASGKVTISLNASNACGNANPKPKTIDVTVSAQCTDASVSPQSGDTQTVNAMSGKTLSLSVTAGGSPTLSYQWYKGEFAIPGKTASTYVKNANVNQSDKGSYHCVVTSSCNESTATSGNFTVNVQEDPAGLALGTGSLTGRTSFDIAATPSGSCGDLSSRESNKANFANLSNADKTYTFTAKSTPVGNVRFVVVDNENCVESTSSLSPNGSGTLANGSSISLTVNYKTTLNQANSIPLIRGRSRNTAAVVMIYAVYNNGSQDVSVPLRVAIQDCMSCGALVAANTWKEFMCHNLGANQSADPFTPTYATNGAYYQFGRKDPAKSAPTSTGTDATNITWNASIPSGYFGDGSTNKDVKVKSSTDPCPTGFRVPNANEWEYVRKSNTTYVGQWTQNSSCTDCWSGRKFGDALMLPAAGYRNETNGSQYGRSFASYYWSASVSSTSNGDANALNFNSFTHAISPQSRRFGYPIRCIAE
jgi:uncharacterized protein (TIGR02145 family)